MSADTWIEKQWAETDPRPRGELLAELKSLRARLAEAERERDRYASDAGERAGKLDAALAKVQQERDEARRERQMFLDRAASLAGKVEAAEAALAKAQYNLTVAQYNHKGEAGELRAELAKAQRERDAARATRLSVLDETVRADDLSAALAKAQRAASAYSEFWERHHADFDAAGNYIPHSQIDGDLRAAEAALAKAREETVAQQGMAIAVGMKLDRAREALTPSADTKAAYMGEFSFDLAYVNDAGNEMTESVVVPWTTIKEIMKAISARAALAPEGK